MRNLYLLACANAVPPLYCDTLDTAKRASFAMKFLREQRAPKSDTGF